MPAKLYSIAGPVAPSGGAGEVLRNHSRTISARMMRADARQEDLRALPQTDRQVAQVRPVIRRQLHQQRLVARAHQS